MPCSHMHIACLPPDRHTSAADAPCPLGLQERARIVQLQPGDVDCQNQEIVGGERQWSREVSSIN